MVEIAGAIARRHLLVEQPYLLQGFRLEVASLVGLWHIGQGQHVPSHVEAGGGEVLAKGIAGLEVDALQHALLQVGGHGFTRLVVAGIIVENLGDAGERLVELRRHLHEVAGHIGAGQTAILTVGEDGVQGVAKLMEHRGDVVPGEQRGLSFRGLGEVAHIEHHRLLLALVALRDELVHPGSAALGGPAVEVAVEERQRLAVLVLHLKHLHVGMVGGDVGALVERESIDAVGGVEHAVLLHAVHIEVGLHLVVADAEQLLLHLGRIVEAVVGLQLEGRPLGLAGILLDGARLGIGLRLVGGDEVAQEGIDVVGVVGHGLLQRVGGPVLVAHQLGLLGAQLGYLGHDGIGVELPRAVGAMDGGLVDAAAQVAVVETGEQGLLGGVDDDDAVGLLAAQALGVLLALCDVGVAQPCQLLLRVYPHHGVVGGIGEHVAPLLLQVGDGLVNLFHAGHLLVAEQGTLAHKLLVGLLQELLLLARERLVFVVVDGLDALEQLLVEGYLVAEVGQHGCHLLLYLGNLRCLVGTDEGEEDAADAAEGLATLLVGQDGVVESGGFGVADDLLHLLPLLLDVIL